MLFFKKPCRKTLPRHHALREDGNHQINLRELEAAKKILAHHGDSINNGELASITHDGLAEIDAGVGLSKTAFAQIIRDVHYVEHFTVKTTLILSRSMLW